MAEPEPESLEEPEDGTVEFFVQLLTKIFGGPKKIKPEKAREYAEGLVAADYDEELFDEEGPEGLKDDFGFTKGHVKKIEKYREAKGGGGGGDSKQDTLMRSSSDAAMLATNFQNLEPEVRKKEVAAALQEHKPDHWTLDEPLGKGGQGLVFRATSDGGAAQNAVKVVPFSNVEHQKKLEREAAFLEKSSDENVISCFRHWCHSFTASKECAPLPPRPLRVRVASAPPSRGLRAG